MLGMSFIHNLFSFFSKVYIKKLQYLSNKKILKKKKFFVVVVKLIEICLIKQKYIRILAKELY